MARIFISHTSADKDFVRQLAEDLKLLGHQPWLDEWEIRVGECIVSRIQQGLEDCDYTVIVLSPNAIQSGWVEKEWKASYWNEIQERRVVILPVMLKDCDVPALLKTKKYADFRTRYPLGLAQLTQAIPPAEFEEQDKLMRSERKSDGAI